MMGNKKVYTDEMIAEALIKSDGFITYAANLLGCHYATIRRAIKDSPFVAECLKVTKEANLDIAETNLLVAIKESNLDAIKFYLRYKGRERGYLKHSKVEVSEDLSKLMREAEERVA